jgi:molybdenum cofactor biosynthesis enzyme MoaA
MATHQQPTAGLEDSGFKRVSISSLDQATAKQNKCPDKRQYRKTIIAGLSIAVLVELAAVLITFFVLRTANRSTIRSRMKSTVNRIHNVVEEQFDIFDHTGTHTRNLFLSVIVLYQYELQRCPATDF